jgi:serine/threonine-protein kinase
MTLNAAKQQLSAAGLEFSSSQESSDRPKNEVTGQSPDAGSMVDAGSTVSLTVSSGPAETKVAVPPLVGLTQSDAQSQLSSVGLVASVQTQSTTIQPQDGRVIDQSPTQGTKVADGSTVVITIGRYEPSGTGGDDNGGASGGLGVD